MERSIQGLVAIARKLFVTLALFFISSSTLAGHAPILFYNVPNWYSGGWDQIRYQTPYDAFAIDWNQHNGVFPAGCLAEQFVSVHSVHSDGYPEDALYGATVNWYNNDCSYGGQGEYSSGARQFAMCAGSDSMAYSPSAWPGGRCPDPFVDPDKTRGAPIAPNGSKGDPVNPSTGNKYAKQDLIKGEGRFPVTFSISYSSGKLVSILAPQQLAVGARRVHNFQMRVSVATNPSLTSAYVLRPDGKVLGFDQSGSAWTGDPDVDDTLTSTRDANGAIAGWTYTRSDKTREFFDANGVLTSIVRQDGLTQTLSYDASGHLQSVTDPQGRSIVLTWDGQNRISGIQDPAGGNDVLAYDASNNLASITWPDNHTFGFVYGENDGATNFAGANDLTGQVDETGNRFDSTTYAQYYGAVRTNVSGAGANPTTIDNGPQGVQNSNQYTVTDGLGVTETTTVKSIFGVSKPVTVTRTCTGCTTQTTSYTYDANGRVATTTDGNGNLTTTTYDATGLLLSTIEAKGTTIERTTATTWDNTLRLPLVRTVKDAGGTILRKEGWVYNAAGQLTAQCLIDPAKAPSYNCAASGTAPAGVRRTVNTYCTAVSATCPLPGLLLNVDGPRTDVTDTLTYAWYQQLDESGCSTLGGACHRPGDLKSVTDGAGLVTTYVSFDKDGRPTRVKAPNGVLTDYTYTPRGWLATTTVRALAAGTPSSSDATTTLGYNPDGTVHQATDPDGVVTTFTYDAAHRLTDITDGQGRRTHYTLDAAGNRTGEQVLTAAGTVVKSMSRSFNALNQLTAMTDGLNRTVFSASYTDSYDANGNLVHTSDGSGVQNEDSFDGLNRLADTLRNYQGVDLATANTHIANTYDALDRLTGFTDPDGQVTSYDINSLNDPTATHSPDTGLTNQTSDIAGNMVSSIDATGNGRAMTYDADNRLLGTTFADASLNIQYRYDEADSTTGCTGNFGKGHLTRVIESDGGISWCYDAFGRVVKKSQTVGTATRTTVYTWTKAGRSATVTTPNGTLVAYTRDTIGNVTTIKATPQNSATTTVVSDVVYKSFGPVASYKLGSGQTVTYTYDLTGVVTDIAGGPLALHFKRDAMGDITAIGSSAGVSTPTETYDYDALHRLVAVKDASGVTTGSYTYSRTGDRLSKSAPGILTGVYSYAPGTHHLTGVGTTSRSVDARGNTTSEVLASGTFGFGYNQRNRLTVVQNGGVTVAGYVLNALGQRVQKNSSGTLTSFDYDEENTLTSEATGSASRDYVWLDGIPVATIDSSGTSASVAYVFSDGMGSPRAVTDGAGTLLWQWPYASNPFGETPPSSTSGYALNLRFPGQYYDVESGLNYNLNRDYEPATGRYLQSDPLGIAAGASTYIYGDGNSLANSDLFGLCDPDRCEELRKQITKVRNELAKRYGDLLTDKLGLPLTGPMSIGGHEQQFENKQAQLRRLLRDFEALNCQGGIPEDSWGWATRDVPTRNLSPRVPTPEAAKNAGMAATGLVLARVLFLVGSALSEFL